MSELGGVIVVMWDDCMRVKVFFCDSGKYMCVFGDYCANNVSIQNGNVDSCGDSTGVWVEYTSGRV